MDNEQAVNEPVEQTTPVESAPIETEATDTSNASADTIVEQKQVSDIPYERFKQVNDRLNDPEYIEKKAREMGIIQEQPQEYEAPVESENPFDDTTTQGVITLAEKAAEAAFEKREAAKWVKQHADDLKDPIVDSRTKDLIRQGYDRDIALTQAKKELSERITPVQKEALAQGVQEGQQLAQKKSEMGAVGTPGSSGKIDPSKLSATDYAKFYGINRV